MIDLDETLNSYKPLVYKIAGKYDTHYTRGLTKDDFVSYGLIGLMKAVIAYNKRNLDTNFATFASCRISAEMQNCLNRELRHHGYTIKQGRVEKVIGRLGEGLSTVIDQEMIIDEEHDIQRIKMEILAVFVDMFGELKADILYKYYFEAYTQEELAYMFNKSQQAVDQQLKRLLDKIKKNDDIISLLKELECK